jgi:PadR family transcriptional regulator, regulatory protein PadR
MTPMDTNEQVLRGTLDLLIMKTLSLTPMHGWGLTHRIQELSKDALRIGQGSIYPALVRLEQRGLIDTSWQTTENNRQAKYYRITPAGRQAMGEELASCCCRGAPHPAHYSPAAACCGSSMRKCAFTSSARSSTTLRAA